MGVPGWSSWLSVCLGLRSWSQCSAVKPRIRLSVQLTLSAKWPLTINRQTEAHFSPPRTFCGSPGEINLPVGTVLCHRSKDFLKGRPASSVSSILWLHWPNTSLQVSRHLILYSDMGQGHYKVIRLLNLRNITWPHITLLLKCNINVLRSMLGIHLPTFNWKSKRRLLFESKLSQFGF